MRWFQNKYKKKKRLRREFQKEQTKPPCFLVSLKKINFRQEFHIFSLILQISLHLKQVFFFLALNLTNKKSLTIPLLNSASLIPQQFKLFPNTAINSRPRPNQKHVSLPIYLFIFNSLTFSGLMWIWMLLLLCCVFFIPGGWNALQHDDDDGDVGRDYTEYGEKTWVRRDACAPYGGWRWSATTARGRRRRRHRRPCLQGDIRWVDERWSHHIWKGVCVFVLFFFLNIARCRT